MAESAEETLFFNSLRLCVSAVEKSWRLKRIYRRDAETQRKDKSKKESAEELRLQFSASLRLCGENKLRYFRSNS
jgi:hypothetical protein